MGRCDRFDIFADDCFAVSMAQLLSPRDDASADDILPASPCLPIYMAAARAAARMPPQLRLPSYRAFYGLFSELVIKHTIMYSA